jgi:hypothetical protein
MQCPNCNFFNMPGSTACGRCGTSLTIGGAGGGGGGVAIDVAPPRAGRVSLRLRRMVPLRRTYYQARDALASTRPPKVVRKAAPYLPPFPVFVRLIFPGWSHFYLRQRLRGHLFLWGFVACLLLMLLNFGTMWGGIWLGMAFSVHSSAALDVVTQTFADAGLRDRMVRSIALSVVLWFGVYYPAGLLIAPIAHPYIVQFPMEPFLPDDVVIVSSFATPRVGRVVMYQLADYHFMLGTGMHGRREEIYSGQAIDRILAGPGDTVECIRGELRVNGQPSRFAPLNAVKLATAFKLTIPQGRWFIVPSGAPRIADINTADAWSTVGIVASEGIVGRAYLRSHPVWRVHWIH